MKSPELATPSGARTAPLPSLSIVFPAFNEERNVRRTVESCRAVADRVAQSWEIIVVNDGSGDGTGALIDALAREFPQVVAVHHAENQGYGAALKSGIVRARHEFIFFSDSDGQFDLDDLLVFAEKSHDFDIVAGYRLERSDPLYRRLNAYGWRCLVRLVLGVRVRDIDCAFKLFRRSVFQRVQIRSVGAMVNTEILAQTERFGLRICELPVQHFPRREGRSTGANLRVIAKAFRELFSLYLKLRRISHAQAGLFPKTVSACRPGASLSPRNEAG
jgi:glycosyltransferase involved in cell wall biosynthesis